MPDDSRILRIGEWRVDPDLDELSREGQTIRLEPRPMRLLLYLAAHAGRVVDVQQLLDEVWPNVIVTHGSVYQAIAQLRRILGDESEHPKYIENLPRRGYRLIAPVASWGVRCAVATDSSPAARGSSVAAEPQLASRAPDAAATHGIPNSTTGQAPRSSLAPVGWSKLPLGAIGAVLAAALAYLTIDKFWISGQPPIASRGAPASERAAQSTSVTVEPVNTAFNPPPHSIAVLPFVNMSGDASQEYFSDGLSEELVNALSRINELRVAARTSSFYFKGEHAELATIAHKLNVGAVLEGSVRRSGHAVRVTAQLNNAVTGFHIWSQVYDRDLGDVLKLQTEIATAVAEALKVTLLADVASRIELGGTRNPAAFDWYLRAAKAYSTANNAADLLSAAAAYGQAIREDPEFALAFAGRSQALNGRATWATGPAAREDYDKALADAERAIALAPELAEAHLALASVLNTSFLDFSGAAEEATRAMELAPGSANVLQAYGGFAVNLGRTEAGLAAIRHAIELDPLNSNILQAGGMAQVIARRYERGVALFNAVIALDPDLLVARAWRGLAYYGLGDYERARLSCEERIDVDNGWNRLCLAWVYHKLGRQAVAEAMLAKNQAVLGDVASYQYAETYAQWGNAARAREWLTTAVRVRDPGLGWLKADPFLDPVRKQPWFIAIERELKFPD